jgi:hypothetical protein
MVDLSGSDVCFRLCFCCPLSDLTCRLVDHWLLFDDSLKPWHFLMRDIRNPKCDVDVDFGLPDSVGDSLFSILKDGCEDKYTDLYKSKNVLALSIISSQPPRHKKCA